MASWNFNEGTGTTVRDSSGNNNTGTIVGATWTTSGHSGTALNFSTGNARVVIPNSASLSLSTNRVTFVCWVFPTNLNSNYSTIIQRSNSAGTWLNWQLYARAANAPTSGRPVFRINWNNNTSNNTGETVQSSVNLSTNQWQKVACTYDGTALRIYVNGTLRGTTTLSGGVIPSSTRAIWIGANELRGEPFRGRIDEFRIYDRALSQAEIQALP